MAYSAYNPKDYVPDFSWISDMGNVAAGVVAAIPKARELSRKLKEDNATKDHVYESMDQWVDNLLVDDSKKLDPTMRANILTNMGIDQETMNDPVKLRITLKESLLEKPKQDETSTDYMKRLMPKLKTAFDAVGTNPENLSWLTKASLAIQGSGMETPEYVSKKIEGLSAAKDFSVTRKLATTPKAKLAVDSPTAKNKDLTTLFMLKETLPESKSELYNSVPNINPTLVESGAFDKTIEDNKIANDAKRAEALQEFLCDPENAEFAKTIYLEGTQYSQLAAGWQAMNGDPTKLEKIVNGTDFQERVVLAAMASDAASKAGEDKESRTARLAEQKVRLGTISDNIVSIDKAAAEQGDLLADLIKKNKGGSEEAKAIRAKIVALNAEAQLNRSVIAKAVGVEDTAPGTAANAFAKFMPQLVSSDPANTKETERIAKELNSIAALYGLTITTGGFKEGQVPDEKARGLTVVTQDGRYLYDHNEVRGMTSEQARAYTAKFIQAIKNWKNDQITMKAVANGLVDPQERAFSYSGSSSSSGSSTIPIRSVYTNAPTTNPLSGTAATAPAIPGSR